MRKYLLPENGNFYKANLHCHTNISDGTLSPEEMKKQYMEKGYSIIAYTDHNIMLPHEDLNEENFLALTGFEWDVTEKGAPRGQDKCCHICLIALEPDNLIQPCWNRVVDEFFHGNGRKYKHLVKFDETKPDHERVYTPECINEVIKEGRDNGFFVTYNHPVWSQEDYRDYIAYENLNAMEICNFASFNAGYPDYNPKVYDDMLRSGKRIFAIAADDNHNYRDKNSKYYDSFGGFTVIKAEKLEYRTITKALEDGNFYASMGPEIKALWYEDGKIHIECSDAERIDFHFGIRKACTFKADEGQFINMAECEVPDYSVYVRATVWDKNGKPANTNAYFVDELNKE